MRWPTLGEGQMDDQTFQCLQRSATLDLLRMAEQGWRYQLDLGPQEAMALVATLQLAAKHPTARLLVRTPARQRMNEAPGK